MNFIYLDFYIHKVVQGALLKIINFSVNIAMFITIIR